MKKFQAPSAHRAGVSHIYFAEVLAFFSTPRKRKNLRKKNPFCLPILDTRISVSVLVSRITQQKWEATWL
jgi:hypothetical protein